MPKGLLQMLEEGSLHDEVLRVWKVLDDLESLYDAFERQQPEAARAAPWFDARERWKAAGRPRAPWYEALKVTEGLR